jgi:hypothetical protein
VQNRLRVEKGDRSEAATLSKEREGLHGSCGSIPGSEKNKRSQSTI